MARTLNMPLNLLKLLIESRYCYDSTNVYIILTKRHANFQVELVIDLEDVAEFDSDLAEQIVDNARRYALIFGEAVQELLPNYKEHEVEAKDALDVYISHRVLVENQHQNDEPARAHKYPPELMRRLYCLSSLFNVINH